MAYRWSWSWGSESAVVLADMGFEFSSTSTGLFAPTTAEQYKPTGAPTKYSMAMDMQDWVQLPLAATAGMDQGVVSGAFKVASASWYAEKVFYVRGTLGTPVEVRMASGALALYIDGNWKATSPVYNFTDWRFVALHFDFRADPWKIKVTVDGAVAIAEYSQADDSWHDIAADTLGAARMYGCAWGTLPWYSGQIIVQDEYADVASPRYVTRISPDADTSETGTWTPTTAGSNFGSTGVDPFDAATYTEEGTPSAGDDVITSYASDLTTLLGGIPGSVDLVTVHSYSTGAANTARAEVGDAGGATTTVGTTTLIGSGTTYAYASATVAPGDSAAWDGTDTPKCKYEVVSV